LYAFFFFNEKCVKHDLKKVFWIMLISYITVSMLENEFDFKNYEKTINSWIYIWVAYIFFPLRTPQRDLVNLSICPANTPHLLVSDAGMSVVAPSRACTATCGRSDLAPARAESLKALTASSTPHPRAKPNRHRNRGNRGQAKKLELISTVHSQLYSVSNLNDTAFEHFVALVVEPYQQWCT
jgi:hypothetical protein